MEVIDEQKIQEIIDGAESKAEAINDLFDLGMTKGQIMKYGFKEATVRKEVDKRKAQGKNVPGTPASEPSVIPTVLRGTETLIPESMVRDIEQYFDGSAEQRRIFSAGMMVPLMGVRLFAEMVKPLTMLINAMKGDQIDSMMKAMALGQQQSRDAAIEASQMTAAQILAGQKETAIASSANPMAAMSAQTMMPFIQNMMNMLMGRLMPGAAPQQSGIPPNWTKRTEK